RGGDRVLGVGHHLLTRSGPGWGAAQHRESLAPARRRRQRLCVCRNRLRARLPTRRWHGSGDEARNGQQRLTPDARRLTRPVPCVLPWRTLQPEVPAVRCCLVLSVLVLLTSLLS